MKKILLIVLISVSIACKQKAKKKQVSKEASLDRKEWIDLFDGASFKGWHQFNSSEMSEAWIIEDGAMVLPDGTGSGKGNDIVSDRSVSYTQLTLPTKMIV